MTADQPRAAALLNVLVTTVTLVLSTAVVVVGLGPDGADDPPRDDPAVAQYRPHVTRLSSEKWVEREEAQDSLIRIGKPAVPALIKASRSADPEAAHRARYILDQIDPVRLSYRIIQIRLDGTPRVIDLLDGHGGEGEEVILIGPGPDRSGATSYSVRPRRVFGGSTTIEVKKGTGGKSHLIEFDDVESPSRSLTIMERGVENFYLRIGSHLRRESFPFLTLFTYLRGRGSEFNRSNEGVDQHPLFKKAAPELVPALVELLREQATAVAPRPRDDLRTRSDAIDILGLLGDAESAPIFRVHLDTPQCTDSALLALARLGEPDGIDQLRGLFDGSNTEVFTDTAPAGRGADLLAVEAAVILAETGSDQAASFLISRLGTVDPNVTHRILVALSGRLDVLWDSEELRERLLEKTGEKDTVFQLPWRDPETEFFYQNIVSALDPTDSGHREWSVRLLTALSEKFSGTDRIGVQELQAVFDLWERISARLQLDEHKPPITRGSSDELPDGSSDTAAADQKTRDKIHRALIGFLADFRSQHSVSKLGAWLVRLFDFRPLPATVFARVREGIAARLEAREDGQESSALALLVQLSRSLPLNQQQTKEIVELLVTAAKSPHHSYGRDILRALQRLTGPPRETNAIQAKKKGRNLKEIEPHVNEWLADDAEIERSSSLRLREWNNSSGAPEVEMIEVSVLVRPSNIDDPKSERSIEILDTQVVRGPESRWLRYDDRFGNKYVAQIVAHDATGRGNGLPTYGVSRPGVRVTQKYREGVPSRVNPDNRLRASWYVSSDRQLYPFARVRTNGASVQQLTIVRRFGDSATGAEDALPADDDEAIWQFVVSEYCSRIATLTKEYEIRQALRDVRAVGIEAFVPCLRETFRVSPSIPLAGELFAAGDIAALEYLHEQLGGDENHFKAAETLATNGNSRGVEHLLELFKGRASKNGSRNINYSAIVASLDAFLLNFDPSSQERDQILDALVAQLDKRAIQDRVFRILQRESRIDFGGILSASRNAGDRVRSEAVKKAREWWAKRKGK